MELGPQHLRMVDALSTTNSISKAAAHLNLSQSAVSTMLRRVERQLGVSLFVRSSEGVTPTTVGREVTARARAILAGVDDLTTAVTQAKGGDSGPALLRVGAQACPALIQLSSELDTLFPTKRVCLQVDQSGGRVVPLLNSGALDIGIVHEPLGQVSPAPSGMQRCVLLEREPVLIGLSEHDPLAASEVVDLAELSGKDLVDDPLDDGAWPAYLRKTCAEAGFAPQVSFWSANWQLSTSLVCSGQAAAFYHPTSRIADGMVLRRLRGDPLGHRIVLLWRPEVAPAARRLRSALATIYLSLAHANPVYSRWWTEHPEMRIPVERFGHTGADPTRV